MTKWLMTKWLMTKWLIVLLLMSKNLKVYKMQFITELRELHFNVKFPCAIKVVWKRSNQSAQSNPVPLTSGIASFNQTLRLNVSMYFDTVASKFVEKKCLYSFLIMTEKGQKSAGTVAVDLAELLNRRLYELDQAFPLEKCPVAGTKVTMKIHYEEEAAETGYDSLSCISATNQLDLSTASLDLSELHVQPPSNPQEEKPTEYLIQKPKENEEKEEERSETLAASGFSKLEASDVEEGTGEGKGEGEGKGIGANIRSINSLTAKIDAFVNSQAKSIRSELQRLKETNARLQQQLTHTQTKQTETALQLQQSLSQLAAERDQSERLQQLNQQANATIAQLSAQLTASGQQGADLQQMRTHYEARLTAATQERDNLKRSLQEGQEEANRQAARQQELERESEALRAEVRKSEERRRAGEEELRARGEELERSRINLERVYEQLVAQLTFN